MKEPDWESLIRIMKLIEVPVRPARCRADTETVSSGDALFLLEYIRNI